MTLKYILFAEAANDPETIVIFSPWLKHREVAEKFHERVPQSAGFVVRNIQGDLCTVGHSESLKLHADPKDAENINLFL